MIKVSLVNWSERNPVEAISHAAKVCYQDTAPEWGATIDVKNRLFATGHHTTFQHIYCTFLIENIAIGDVTFGLHLASPFYNTSQRSGRFCAKMFSAADFGAVERYIKTYWPNASEIELKIALDYVKYSAGIYSSNIERAVAAAKEFIREERPNAGDKYIEQNAPKIAQEQLRMFIPVIFPTALEFTVNLSALAGLYRSAWSPALRDVTEKMAGAVLAKWPELDFMFQNRVPENEQALKFLFLEKEIFGVKTKPELDLISAENIDWFTKPNPENLHPLDLLHFLPELMDNNVSEIKTEVEISVATFGQDQRHRTVRRGRPVFTYNFYLPPICDYLGLEKKAREVLEMWRYASIGNAPALSCVLAPYGAMVRYKKSSPLNAAIHELGKRLCWCAQEEIYHLAAALRGRLGGHPMTEMMSPACVLTGKCGEGVRYCGRDMKKIKLLPFPERKV